MLPPAYFTQELRTLHVELVVLNDLLSYFFPKLSSHLNQLQYVYIDCTVNNRLFLGLLILLVCVNHIHQAVLQLLKTH